jgi:glutathione peroxidase
MFKKLFSYLSIGVISMALFSFLSSSAEAAKLAKDVYGFEFQNIDEDGKIKLSDYKGKVVMIVNGASECGFTPQYAQLQALYTKYKDQGFVVIGVPSNDFGGQEPGTGKDIARFCEINYGVTFPLTSKYVVSGGNAHPFYLWAKAKLGFGTAPKWNFHKYLINRQGKLVDYFNSNTAPDADRVVSAIEKLLAQK